MNLFAQVELLQRIDRHIRLRSSGSPKSFAKRLKISERSWYRILEELKDLGVHIEYNKERRYYEYIDENTIATLLKGFLGG